MRAVWKTTVVALCLATASARAQPTSDIAGWAERFTQAALRSQADEIVGDLTEIADPRLKIDGLPALVRAALSVAQNQTPEYSEQFSNKDVGDFMKRINIAVKYSNGLLFYSVVAVRSAAGWQLVQINVDGNINKILDAPWPG